MCGIAGIFDLGGKRTIDHDALSRMSDQLVHRGPDDSGTHVEPGIGLAHRRLSIIDLGGGHQPIFNEDETVCVVFNGEIYNFQELRKDLENYGHRFKTKTDTEVIVHAWEQWGDACVEHFQGMFAFGIWDRNQETLFVARDRLGIKPLYYTFLNDQTFLFGSELPSLLANGQVSRELDEQAVEDYFALGYVPDPRSIIKDVYKLAPGHVLRLRRGGGVVSPRRYWDLNFRAGPARSESSINEELIYRLREAVKSRLIADVPLGAFLSGGVDSSAVVAMMAGLTTEPVNTCAISFDDPGFDEAPYAEQVARQYGTRHRHDLAKSDDFDLVEKMPGVFGEPFADNSALPTYQVCRLARTHVKVALSGDGGDENFAGYRRYRMHMAEEKIRNMLPAAVRGPIFGGLGWLYPKADWAPRVMRAKTTLQSLGVDAEHAYFQSVSISDLRSRQNLYTDQFRRKLDGYTALEVFRGLNANEAADESLSRAQYLDFKTWLPGGVLTKVDRASMANSLEVRVPLLDHRFVEFAAGLPPNVKLKGGEGKHVFKTSLGNYLPKEILYRQKQGFSVPLAAWLRGPLRGRISAMMEHDGLFSGGVLERKRLIKLTEQHMSGRSNHDRLLWACLNFDGFLKSVIEGAGPAR